MKYQKLRLGRLAFASSAIFCALSFASATEIKQNLDPKPGPIIDKPQGGPTKVVWSDGREATLSIATIDAQYTTLPIKIFENLCHTAQNTEPVICEAHFGVKAARFSLVWTKNPDPKKLGKPIKVCGAEK